MSVSKFIHTILNADPTRPKPQPGHTHALNRGPADVRRSGDGLLTDPKGLSYADPHKML